MGFNPNQRRDSKGRFSSGGGGGSAVTSERKRLVTNLHGRGGRRMVTERTFASGAKQTIIPARKRRR